MIEIKNLNKKYGSHTALKDVNLTINQGEIIGLFGENGAGKTTLMKCILNYLGYQGDILLDGQNISNKNIGSLSFATCEHSFFPNITATEHADFYNEHFPKFNEKRFNALMDFFHLPKYKKIREFSTGQQNQFEVIMALSQGADYILMDEPFAGNDIFNREDFYKVLMGILEPNETVILSTHLIEEVSDCIGRAILLHRGEVVGDTDVSVLNEQGISLTEYIKKAYGYESGRVSKAISEILEEE